MKKLTKIYEDVLIVVFIGCLFLLGAWRVR